LYKIRCVFDATVAKLYHSTVMSDKLPELIDPILLADRRSEFSGALKLAGLVRLSAILATSDGDIDVEVFFAKEGKRSVVVGSIKGMLALECQSCLQALQWALDLHFKLGVVSSLDEADRIGLDCEPLLFNGEKISLHSLLEDEILLALPDYPKHGYDCIKRSHSENSDYVKENNPAKADNPFSVLAKLKKTGD
jgi:uncharacterized protein